MKSRFMVAAIAAGVTALTFGGEAAAQKSADTLRTAVTEPYVSMSPYIYPATEASFINTGIFQQLLGYDERNLKFVPVLAKSWKRVDDRTLEFTLAEGIKFHNGNPLTADDVVASVNFAIDPNLKFRFKENHDWIERIEKTGPYSVRVHAKELTATDLLHFAFRAQIMDAKVLAGLDDKSEYGRRVTVGSGPYKAVSFDRNAGVVIERADTFTPDNVNRAPIGKLRVNFIPDRQTQTAQLLTGGIDLMFNISPDDARDLAAQPKVTVTEIDSLTGLYLLLDAAGRSGKKELSDVRVRRALLMAIDRRALIDSVVPGAKVATQIDALCFAAMDACGYSVKPPPYDIEGAKKLLTEAGYPDGFDMVLDTQLRARNIATAISGMLRKINVRASINPMETGVMFKKWQDGEVQALINNAPAGNWPDASYLLGINFGSELRDTVRDQVITDSIRDGAQTHDPAKRKAIYTRAFSRMNELASHFPISSMPVAYAHTSDAEFRSNPLSPTRTQVMDIFWK
jgi:peptide/nickel transport system substrate-binding protein